MFIIPTISPSEIESIFLNLEEKPQQTTNLFSISNDFKSLKLFSSFFFKSIRNIKNDNLNFIFETITILKLFNSLSFLFVNTLDLNYSSLKLDLCSTYPFKSTLEDFYASNTYSKNSPILGRCSQKNRNKFSNF